MGVVVETKDCISFWEGLGELVTVALCKTPDGNDGSGSASLLQITRRQQGIDGVLFGCLDETAGVDDHRISFSWIAHQPEAAAIQLCGKLFGIDFIASTTQRDQVHRRWLRVRRTMAVSPNGGCCGLKHGRPSMTDIDMNHGVQVSGPLTRLHWP
jgi:hypothetical protein